MNNRELKGIDAKIIEHTVTEGGDELITFQLQAPKFLDAQICKHRMWSANSSSDRAIPFNKMCEVDYYIPEEFRINQAGMQGYEKLDAIKSTTTKTTLSTLRFTIIKALQKLKEETNIHKQHLNRYLLPWSYQSKVATMNKKWLDAFLHLRLAKGADPAIQELAKAMKEAYENSAPMEFTEVDIQWHLPYITDDEFIKAERGLLLVEHLVKASVARCARVSYNNHDGSSPDIEKDIELHVMLLRAGHMSCFEHIARPMSRPTISGSSESKKLIHTSWEEGITHITKDGNKHSGNFTGYIQYRQALPYSCNDCEAKHSCDVAWDEYNINGDCLALK